MTRERVNAGSKIYIKINSERGNRRRRRRREWGSEGMNAKKNQIREQQGGKKTSADSVQKTGQKMNSSPNFVLLGYPKVMNFVSRTTTTTSFSFLDLSASPQK